MSQGRKLSSLLIVVSFLAGSASHGAAAKKNQPPVNTMLPTLKEMDRLAPSVRAAYLQAIREFLVNTELHSGIKLAENDGSSNDSLNPVSSVSASFIQNFLYSLAYADTQNPDEQGTPSTITPAAPIAGNKRGPGDRCMYAGNDADMVGGTCTLRDKNRCTMDDGKTPGVSCNPLLFGLTSTGQNYCVIEKVYPNHATRRCELAANGGKESDDAFKKSCIDIANKWQQIEANAGIDNKNAWQGMLDNINTYCDNPQALNNRPYKPILKGEAKIQTDCDILRKRVNAVKEALASVRETPPAPLPPPPDVAPAPVASTGAVFCQGNGPDGKPFAIGGVYHPENSGLEQFPRPIVYQVDAATGNPKDEPDLSYSYSPRRSNTPCTSDAKDVNCGYAFFKGGTLHYFDRGDVALPGGAPACVDRTEQTKDVCSADLPDPKNPGKSVTVSLKATLYGDGSFHEIVQPIGIKNADGSDGSASGYFYSTASPLDSSCGAGKVCGVQIKSSTGGKFFTLNQPDSGTNCVFNSISQQKEDDHEGEVCNSREHGSQLFCAGKDPNPATNGGRPFKKVVYFRYEKGGHAQVDAVICDSKTEDGKYEFVAPSYVKSQYYAAVDGKGLDLRSAVNDDQENYPDKHGRVKRPPQRRATRYAVDNYGKPVEIFDEYSQMRTRVHLGTVDLFGREIIDVANVCGYKLTISRHKVGNYKDVCEIHFKDEFGNKLNPPIEPFYVDDTKDPSTNPNFGEASGSH